jgi:hypothetical protein
VVWGVATGWCVAAAWWTGAAVGRLVAWGAALGLGMAVWSSRVVAACNAGGVEIGAWTAKLAATGSATTARTWAGCPAAPAYAPATVAPTAPAATSDAARAAPVMLRQICPFTVVRPSYRAPSALSTWVGTGEAQTVSPPLGRLAGPPSETPSCSTATKLNACPTRSVSPVGRIGADVLAAIGGVAASTGSACHAGTVELSPVLAAMDVTPHAGMGAVRFSLGRPTTVAEVDTVLDLAKVAVGLVQVP